METHPSICIWSLHNEYWGAEDIAINADARQYITDMHHYKDPAPAIPGDRQRQLVPHLGGGAAEIGPAHGSPLHPRPEPVEPIHSTA